MAADDLRCPNVRKRVVRAFRTGGGLFEGCVRRDGRNGSVFADRQVFGMRAERAFEIAENTVAHRERGDAAADCLDCSRELSPKDPTARLWPPEPGEEPQDERPGRAVAAVRPIDRRRLDLDQQLVLACFRRLHIRDPNNVRRAVPGADRCLHDSAVSPWSYRAASAAPRCCGASTPP